MQLPVSARRVPAMTEDRVNERIRYRTIASITRFARHPDLIERRLDELDQEWDVERVLETNAATLALTGTILGVLSGKRWLLLSAVVTGFLLQHGVQGWCPPLPLLRRLGVRTAREIEAERYALMALRGDFDDIDRAKPHEAALATGRLGQRGLKV